MYTALYRSKRPEVFSEILGQDHIVRILKNQIKTNTVSHAYLFCGTRGTGKTTTARVLAKAVNCLSDEDRPCGKCENCMSIKDGTFMDVIEIDAASNNGVDNIRELRESVKYPPAVGRKKIYIIDEVHMLSPGAANALLKTLEEPPENVMFILATTDPQRLPQTILSRCMRLDFKRVSEEVLMEHMREICSSRGVEITEPALKLLAVNADGSVRDSLSILDQCLSAGDKSLDRDVILDFLGTESEEFFIDLTEKVILGNVSEALILLDKVMREGKDVKQIMKDWMSHYRNLLITKYIKNPEDMLNMSGDNVNLLREQSNRISLDEIDGGITTLSKTINDARYSTQPRILLELAIVTIAGGLTYDTKVVKARGGSAGLAPKPVSMPKQATAPKQAAAPKQEPEIKTAVETRSASEESFSEEDLEDIWREVFEAGEGAKASFNIIRTGTHLVAMNDHEFKIVASTDFVRDYVEDNRAEICRIMEEKTGKARALSCKVEGAREDEDEIEKLRKIAEEGKKKFGIEIEIE